MARYSEIENEIVINVFVADEQFVQDFKPNAIQSPDWVCLGDRYENGEFVKVQIEIKNDEAEAL